MSGGAPAPRFHSGNAPWARHGRAYGPGRSDRLSDREMTMQAMWQGARLALELLMYAVLSTQALAVAVETGFARVYRFLGGIAECGGTGLAVE